MYLRTLSLVIPAPVTQDRPPCLVSMGRRFKSRIHRRDRVRRRALRFRRVLFFHRRVLRGLLWILVTLFQPAQMHSSNSPVNGRPTLAPPHSLSGYSQPSSQYVSVKAEDDYSSSHHSHSNHHTSSHSGHGHYTLPPFSQTMPDHPMDNWHGYSSERAPLHR